MLNDLDLLASNILTSFEKYKIPSKENISDFLSKIKKMNEVELSKLPEIIELYGFLYETVSSSDFCSIYSLDYQESIYSVVSVLSSLISDNTVKEKIVRIKKYIDFTKYRSPKYVNIIVLKNKKSGLYNVPMQERQLHSAILFLKDYYRKYSVKSLVKKDPEDPELRYVRDDIDALYFALDKISKK